MGVGALGGLDLLAATAANDALLALMRIVAVARTDRSGVDETTRNDIVIAGREDVGGVVLVGIGISLALAIASRLEGVRRRLRDSGVIRRPSTRRGKRRAVGPVVPGALVGRVREFAGRCGAAGCAGRRGRGRVRGRRVGIGVGRRRRRRGRDERADHCDYCCCVRAAPGAAAAVHCSDDWDHCGVVWGWLGGACSGACAALDLSSWCGVVVLVLLLLLHPSTSGHLNALHPSATTQQHAHHTPIAVQAVPRWADSRQSGSARSAPCAGTRGENTVCRVSVTQCDAARYGVHRIAFGVCPRRGNGRCCLRAHYDMRELAELDDTAALRMNIRGLTAFGWVLLCR